MLGRTAIYIPYIAFRGPYNSACVYLNDAVNSSWPLVSPVLALQAATLEKESDDNSRALLSEV